MQQSSQILAAIRERPRMDADANSKRHAGARALASAQTQKQKKLTVRPAVIYNKLARNRQILAAQGAGRRGAIVGLTPRAMLDFGRLP
jgi:hypothetical protein